MSRAFSFGELGMSKFLPGDLAILVGPCRIAPQHFFLKKYQDTLVTVCFRCLMEGSWYVVEGEDGVQFICREEVLKKLPGQDLTGLYNKMNWSPPPKLREIKVSSKRRGIRIPWLTSTSSQSELIQNSS